MTNSRSSSNTLEKLYDSGNISASSSHTYTPASALNLENYAEIQIIAKLTNGSSAELQMQLNSDTSASYDYLNMTDSAGTLSSAAITNDTKVIISANNNSSWYARIFITKGENDTLQYQVYTSEEDFRGTRIYGYLDTASITTLTAVKLLTSTGNFTGRILVYGLKI